MQIYHYDRDAGEYIGVGESDVCPVTGNDIIPAWATTTQPPACGENQTVKFIGGTWIAENIPQPEPEPEPTAEEILASAKATKLAQIKQLLAETDYKCLKFVDGDLTTEDYAEIKARRASLRAAYNTIEAATTLDEVNAVIY